MEGPKSGDYVLVMTPKTDGRKLAIYWPDSAWQNDIRSNSVNRVNIGLWRSKSVDLVLVMTPKIDGRKSDITGLVAYD